MTREVELALLRVWLRSSDRSGWFAPPVVEELLSKAQKAGLSGATVLEGVCGLWIDGSVLEPSAWALTETVPLIVEFVDRPSAIGGFLDAVAATVRDGLATVEMVRALRHPDVGGSDVPSSLAEVPSMNLAEDGRLLRVYIGESDTLDGEPLYRAIVLKAKELGLAGATVLRGPMGFGANSRVHTGRLIETSSDLPILIEIVDAPAKVEALLPYLDEVVGEGLITVEDVRVLRYRHGPPKG